MSVGNISGSLGSLLDNVGDGLSSATKRSKSGISASGISDKIASLESDVQTSLKNIANKKDVSEVELAQVQEKVQKLGRLMNTLTNIMKAIHDMMMSIIRNLRVQ